MPRHYVIEEIEDEGIAPSGEETLETLESQRAEGELLATLGQILATERGVIKIHKVSKNVKARDLENILPDPIFETRRTTIKAKYAIEDIPVPSINNIRTLVSTTSIFNKPKLQLDREEGEEAYATDTSNFIFKGNTSNISIGGDIGTHYTIVVQDITNTKWYNFDREKFEDGYNEKCGHCGEGSLSLRIPPEILETTYNVYFKTSGGEIYDAYLPTETSPWVINQLAEVTTTFKFSDGDGYTSDKTSTKTHAPGVILNAGSTNSGEIPITITTVATRGVLALNAEKSANPNVSIFDMTSDGGVNGDTYVAYTDLTASVSGQTGTITGTIILGQSSIRDANVLFSPTQFFTIT